MTIRDIAKVTWTVTRLDITAREEDNRYLRRWIIGEEAPFIGHGGLFLDIAKGEVSDIEKKINVHNNRKANGQPEIGWGLDDTALPAELLNAEITRLGMRCRNGIEYEVDVDLIFPALVVEMMKEEMGQLECERGDV